MTPRSLTRWLAREWTVLRRDRPVFYSRPAWIALFALDVLPWPWGESLLGALFAGKAFVRPRRLRQAMAWAGAQPVWGWRRWRLALSACAHHGRFLARQALVGIRSPEAFARHAVVRGGERLAGLTGGAILLSFHIGPPCTSVALRLAGHRLTWVGGRRASRRWASPAWQPFVQAARDIPMTANPDHWAAVLYRARRVLLDGGIICMMGDGGGRDAFRLALPGRLAAVRSGWFVLRRQCRVPVLPVLSHLEGRTEVVTVHPPLPPIDPDPERDLAACRDVLASLLAALPRAVLRVRVPSLAAGPAPG
jgi:lauroyl/myristoyl acyltransferase